MQNIIIGSRENYFNIFNIPESFAINLALLESKYQELLQKYHPDKFSSADEKLQRQSLIISADINSAYQILKNSVTRANYLLQIWGYAKVLEDRYIAPEFVELQIIWREKIGECNDYIQLEEYIEEINKNICALEEQLTEQINLLRSIDVPPNQIAHSIKQLQLWQKLLELANEREI